jgi:hypothetical protein
MKISNQSTFNFGIMNSNLKYLLFVLCVSPTLWSQVRDENIGTEVVNVVKPYTPTISDAFKVKETPTFDDEETAKKENISYTIFSFPVASTFTPAKGKAANVEKSAQEKYFKNYMTLGAGNYGTINAELFVTENINNTDYFGGMLRHLSSQGGIENVILDDKFFNTSLDLTYGSRTKKMSWNTDLGYQNQVYNWYGLNRELFDTTFDFNRINEQQTYQNFYVAGRLNLNDSFLKESTLKLNRFWDAFGSAENNIIAKPAFEFEIGKEKITTHFILDHLSGSFERNYFTQDKINYGFTNIGFQPSIKINKDALSINAGVGLFYSMATEAGENKFFIYPQINGSYKVVGDIMVAYAGVEGTLQQNSFRDFTQQNFFVSPTLNIAPTDQQYDVFVGLKGKLANSMSYNIRGSYKNEDGRALFKNNIFEFFTTDPKGYHYGNSFEVVYDEMKTVSFYGELKADFSKNVRFGVNGTFNSYSTNTQAEAWNLPELNLATTLDVEITPKWYAGTQLFFVGERKDQLITSGIVATIQNVTLNSYFDLNAHIGYKHNERFTFFLRGNNLANQDYQRWLNYPVQGIQVLGGASYKFDF